MSHPSVEAPDERSPNLYSEASTADRRILDRIFQHPLSHGLVWREIVGLVTRIADVEEKKDGELFLHANGEALVMGRPDAGTMAADDVMALRHFLTGAGWAPDATGPSAAPKPSSPEGVIVVIDNDGARIFKVGGSGILHTDAAHGDTGLHIVHHRVRTDHDRDRDQTFPYDSRFFDQVSLAIGQTGRIVLISDGKGQSNAASHLSAYLLSRKAQVHGRIIATLRADLERLGPSVLIQLGQDALARNEAHA